MKSIESSGDPPMATPRTGLLSRRRLLAAVPVLSASLFALPRIALAWEHIGGVDVLGPPISELQMTWDREYQAFRNGVLFRDIDFPTYGTRNAPVRPMLVGDLWAGRRPGSLDPEK